MQLNKLGNLNSIFCGNECHYEAKTELFTMAYSLVNITLGSEIKTFHIPTRQTFEITSRERLETKTTFLNYMLTASFVTLISICQLVMLLMCVVSVLIFAEQTEC